MKWLTDIGDNGTWVLILGTAMICLTAGTVSCHYNTVEETRIKFEDTNCETKVFAMADKCMINAKGMKVLCLQELPAALKECND